MAGLNSFLKIFMPKNRIFFELFEKVADNGAKMGSLLRDIVAEPDFDKRASLIIQVEDLEHANDELTHSIFTELAHNIVRKILKRNLSSFQCYLVIHLVLFSFEKEVVPDIIYR